jgi:hypothetical protein
MLASRGLCWDRPQCLVISEAYKGSSKSIHAQLAAPEILRMQNRLEIFEDFQENFVKRDFPANFRLHPFLHLLQLLRDFFAHRNGHGTPFRIHAGHSKRELRDNYHGAEAESQPKSERVCLEFERRIYHELRAMHAQDFLACAKA